MEYNIEDLSHKIRKYFKNIAEFLMVFSFGGLFVHFVIMLIHYYTFQKPHSSESEFDLVRHVFTSNMIPMMIVYGFLVSTIIYLLKKLRLKIKDDHDRETAHKCELERLSTLQLITATMIEKIAKHNNEILEWIQLRKRNGQASQKVENASKQIAQSLHSLSELSYAVQYGEKACKDINDIKKYLNNVL